MNFAPTDLVSAHRWERATFTTDALSLSFFEAVVLDALVRGGARQARILADVQGVRASLSEQGAQRVGKDSNVEPVTFPGGHGRAPERGEGYCERARRASIDGKGPGCCVCEAGGDTVEALERLSRGPMEGTR